MVHVATDHDTGQVDIQPFEFLTEHVAFGVHKQRVDFATEQVKKSAQYRIFTQRFDRSFHITRPLPPT